MRLILAFLCATVAWAQYPVNGGLGGGGGGFTAPSGYRATVTGLTTLTVTAAQHGQGPAPTAWCFDNAAPALATSCSYTVSSIGDVVFTWSPAFTGYVLIRGPGASAGAAGDVVGPSSSTSGCVAYFSGTSGKIITCAPTGLFYDAANVRLGVGNSSPTANIEVKSGSAYSDKIFKLLGSSGSSALTVTGDGRIFAGADSGRNSVLDVNFSGLKTSGNLMTMFDGTYTTTFGTSSFVSTNPTFGVGSNNFGNAISTLTPTANYVLNVVGQGVLLGTTTDLGYGLHAANKGTNGNLLVFDPTGTVGVSSQLITAGQGQGSTPVFRIRAYNATPGSGTLGLSILDTGRIVTASANEATGAGTPLFGTNSPAVTNTAPYTWIKFTTSDGSTVYVPAWK